MRTCSPTGSNAVQKALAASGADAARQAENKLNEARALVTCVTLAPGVRRIRAPNPGMMTGSGTNTYLLGLGEIAVLDPGPDEPGHLDAILAQAGAQIRWVITTHTHKDHSPLARKLGRETGARLIGLPPPADGRQDETFHPDLLPIDGETLVLGGISLVAIHTPGHASNCVCYLLARERVLFTGDHVLGGVSPVILPPDGEMAAYLHSLEKLAAYDFEFIAPGHGEIMPRGKRMIELLHAHRMMRESKVLRCLGDGAASLAHLTSRVYDDVPAERHEWARLTLLAHLIKLAREDRVVERAGTWRIAAG
jgi:glyoxylase-like metal-dependent hydrolase (beta-lactamase superfamily II)